VGDQTRAVRVRRFATGAIGPLIGIAGVATGLLVH
jgi:hypothetical protein